MAIARALVTKPDIVLLDEPLCNLDIQLRIEMRTEMAQLFHSLRTTVFHVTHDPSEAFCHGRQDCCDESRKNRSDGCSFCVLHGAKDLHGCGTSGSRKLLEKVSTISDSGRFCKVKSGED